MDIYSMSADGSQALRFLEVANKVLTEARDQLHSLGRTDKTGVYINWTFRLTPIVTWLWGQMSQEKTRGTHFTVLDKVTNLTLHPDHLTSYRTRNPKARIKEHGRWVDRPRWGGAIRAAANIISISGFPEKWDEACAFVIAIKMGWLEQAFVLRRISSKRNPHLRPLLQACHWTE